MPEVDEGVEVVGPRAIYTIPVVEFDTHPPARATVICADELGQVIARTFPPASGWSADGLWCAGYTDIRPGTH
ncbi:hypothetical protein ACNTMW_13445 [Planosporangium sp. 12N6]|uniref:hypothetical protein n=1 Tax=Planosporangium spinosum TaxID=3402278 RepID=UPI003CF4F5CE